MIAVTQVRHDTSGRAYYRRKQTEGHSRKKRCAPSSGASATPSTTNSSPTSAADQRAREDTGNDSNGQRDRLYTLTAGPSVKPLPDPTPRYAPYMALSHSPQPDPRHQQDSLRRSF